MDEKSRNAIVVGCGPSLLDLGFLVRQHLGEDRHTVDVCPGQQAWILRECLGDVVVRAVHILVFLQSEADPKLA